MLGEATDLVNVTRGSMLATATELTHGLDTIVRDARICAATQTADMGRVVVAARASVANVTGLVTSARALVTTARSDAAIVTSIVATARSDAAIVATARTATVAATVAATAAKPEHVPINDDAIFEYLLTKSSNTKKPRYLRAWFDVEANIMSDPKLLMASRCLSCEGCRRIQSLMMVPTFDATPVANKYSACVCPDLSARLKDAYFVLRRRRSVLDTCMDDVSTSC